MKIPGFDRFSRKQAEPVAATAGADGRPDRRQRPLARRSRRRSGCGTSGCSPGSSSASRPPRRSYVASRADLDDHDSRRGRRDSRDRRRSARHEDARAAGFRASPARPSCCSRWSRSGCSSSSSSSAGSRAVVRDQVVLEPGRRQDPSWAKDAGVDSSEHCRQCRAPASRRPARRSPGCRRRDPRPDLARLLPDVQRVRDVLPAEGRPGRAELRRPPPRRAGERRDGHHRQRHSVAAALLPRRDDRRHIQRCRRRCSAPCSWTYRSRDDRRRHVRDCVHPVHRCLHLRGFRRAAHAVVAGHDGRR